MRHVLISMILCFCTYCILILLTAIAFTILLLISCFMLFDCIILMLDINKSIANRSDVM